jgi:hypothetical protein
MTNFFALVLDACQYEPQHICSKSGGFGQGLPVQMIRMCLQVPRTTRVADLLTAEKRSCEVMSEATEETRLGGGSGGRLRNRRVN